MKVSMEPEKLLSHVRSCSLDISGYSGSSWADMEEDPEPAQTTVSTEFQEKQLKRTPRRDISSGRHQEYRQTTSDQTFLANPVTKDEFWETEEDLEIIRDLTKEKKYESKTLVSKFISKYTPLSQLVVMKSTLRNAKHDYIHSESYGYYPQGWLYDAVEQERRISKHIVNAAWRDPFSFSNARTEKSNYQGIYV